MVFWSVVDCDELIGLSEDELYSLVEPVELDDFSFELMDVLLPEPCGSSSSAP